MANLPVALPNWRAIMNSARSRGRQTAEASSPLVKSAAGRARLYQDQPCAVIGCMGRWVHAFGWRVGAGGAWPEAWLGLAGTGRAGDRGRYRDVPRRETAAGADRGTILAEACARRECALAYRAVVEAVYAEAELGVVAPPSR